MKNESNNIINVDKGVDMKSRGIKSWKILSLIPVVFCLAASNLPGRCRGVQTASEVTSICYLNGQFVGVADAPKEIDADFLDVEVYGDHAGQKAELKRKEKIRLASRKIRVAFSKLSDPRGIADSIEHRIKIIRKRDDEIIEEFNGEGGFYEFFVDLDPAQYTVKYGLKVNIKDKYYQERLEQLHRGKIRKAWSEILVDKLIDIKNKPGTKYTISHRISITEGVVPYGIKVDNIKVKTHPDFFK